MEAPDALDRDDAALRDRPLSDPEDVVVAVVSEGIRTADGTLHELDVIVLATGFRVDRFVRPIEVSGAGGAVRFMARALDPDWQVLSF